MPRSFIQSVMLGQGTLCAHFLQCCSSQGRCGVGTDHCSPGKCDPMWGVCSAASAPQPGPSSQTDPKTIVGIVSGILVGIGMQASRAFTPATACVLSIQKGTCSRMHSDNQILAGVVIACVSSRSLRGAFLGVILIGCSWIVCQVERTFALNEKF